MNNINKIAKIVREYHISAFSAMLQHENDLENIIEENEPDEIYCEVKVLDRKMRSLPNGWEMVDFENGIARCKWGEHKDACVQNSCFLMPDSKEPWLADYYKVAVWNMGDYSLELKAFTTKL